ncbi:MAG TPA: hypothetical protein VKL40_16700 [Candidatus Angelobacter sp.]|nr:hypothetical protein [Candidatus Angelobacter sp.]
MKTRGIFVALLMLVLLTPAFAQQKVFQWQPANDESVRLDPANYHAGRVYHPGPDGGGMHIDVQSALPVTIAMARSSDWSQAMQRHELLADIPYFCRQEHVVKATYTCQLPPAAMVLIIHDERNSVDRAVFAGMGAVLDPNSKVDRAIGVGVATVLTGQGSATRHFVSPNDVHIQYYRWACIENCIQPEFQWIRQFKEKYELTSFTKVYGGLLPEHDGEKVSVKIKSPVPMAVAILPSKVADQLHAQADAFETALQQNSCQQRGVQSLTFECTFNVADGPQSLIVVPEAGQKIPHKKAEIDVFSLKCVANCTVANN